jgi:ATP/maltotriose-dependent transcriptional regulator MalT
MTTSPEDGTGCDGPGPQPEEPPRGLEHARRGFPTRASVHHDGSRTTTVDVPGRQGSLVTSAPHQSAGPAARTVIAVKAQVPPLRGGLVVRERLVSRLLGDGSSRLTVVVAPAGWGKTTLLGQWVRRLQAASPVAWVSLDESDDEPVRFWTYVLTALQRVSPRVADGALRALGAPGVDPVDVTLPVLLNALAATDERHVLVLDDYHVLTDAQLHKQVEFLVAYAPASLQVVIAGRYDPELPLARLRAAGQLTEVRAADLRFTSEEAGALVAQVADVVLPADTLTGMLDRTEGWAAGLHLAALTVRSAENPVQRAAVIRGDDRHILDYFSTEVLAHAGDDERRLLLRCSVLERLSGSLCDAVLGRRDSAALLEQLERSNLFLTALDDRREWYHCHRLFRDALRRELDRVEPDQVQHLRLRAADWFLGRRQIDEAVRHRLAAGDDDGAADLLTSSIRWFVDRGAYRTYLQLGGQVSAAAAAGHPGLCVALAWAAALTGQVELVRPWLEAAEPALTDDSPVLHGWSNLRAAARNVRAISGHRGDTDRSSAIADAEEAVALEADPTVIGCAVARMTLGRVRQDAGEPEAAVEVLAAALRLPVVAQVPGVLTLQAAGALACALLDVGRVASASRVCRDVAVPANALEERWGDATGPVLTLLRTAEGRAAYARGEAVTARTLLNRAVALAGLCGDASHLVLALTALAEAELSNGDTEAAKARLAEAHDLLDSQWTLHVAARAVRAAEARIGRPPGMIRPDGLQLPTEELTERELTVLRALQGQLSQREIGASMFISLNTVKGYTKSLYRKLDVTSRQAAVQRGRALGLI